MTHFLYIAMLPILHLSKEGKTSSRKIYYSSHCTHSHLILPTCGYFALQTQPQTRQGNTNGPQIQLVMTPQPTGPHQPLSNFITFPCLQPNHRQLLATTSTRMIWAAYCPKARDGVHWSTCRVMPQFPATNLALFCFLWA